MVQVGSPDSPTGGGGGGTTFDLPDRESLVGFIEDLRELMGEVVYGDLLPEELAGEYREALEGLSGHFELVIAQLRQPAIDDYLRVAGLTGALRRLKQGTYDAARAMVGKIRDQPARAIRVAFKAANIILGSLSSIPGVEPIKEFKEGLEVRLELAELGAAAAGRSDPT